jgi:hypothetical protein
VQAFSSIRSLIAASRAPQREARPMLHEPMQQV